MSLPLVLVPTILSDARLFSVQIVAFSRERTVIVAPLLEGERVEAMASALLGQLPPRFAVAGVGLGGMVAMDMLRQAADRLDRLCLIDTSPLPETPAMAADREVQIVQAQTGRLEEVLAALIRPELLAGPRRVRVLEAVRAMGRDMGGKVLAHQLRALMRTPDSQAVLRRCRLPVTLICGAEDRIYTPRRHELMQALIPKAKLEVIPEAGLLPPLEQPDATTAAMRRWLEGPLVLH